MIDIASLHLNMGDKRRRELLSKVRFYSGHYRNKAERSRNTPKFRKRRLALGTEFKGAYHLVEVDIEPLCNTGHVETTWPARLKVRKVDSRRLLGLPKQAY